MNVPGTEAPARTLLPTRRQNRTFELEFAGIAYAVTVGYWPAAADPLACAAPGEVFCHPRTDVATGAGYKIGSATDLQLSDFCVVLSTARQMGVPFAVLATGMGRYPGGAPASVFGALLDALAAEEAAP